MTIPKEKPRFDLYLEQAANTLAIDTGGTGIKMLRLEESGQPILDYDVVRVLGGNAQRVHPREE